MYILVLSRSEKIVDQINIKKKKKKKKKEKGDNSVDKKSTFHRVFPEFSNSIIKISTAFLEHM